MTDLSWIAGCFPDVRCMASVLRPRVTVDLSYDVVMWVFGALAVIALVLGFVACNISKGEE